MDEALLKQQIADHHKMIEAIHQTGQALRQSLVDAGWSEAGIYGYNGGILMISPRLAEHKSWSPDLDWDGISSILNVFEEDGDWGGWSDHVVEILVHD